MYTRWLRKGPLYKSVSNKCKGFQTVATIQVISRPLLNSGLRRLSRYGTHQTINERLELVHLPSDLILEWPGEGPLFQLELKNAGANMWALFESPLGHYLCQVWDPWPSFIIFIKFVEIMYLLTSKKVEGSLSKHLCLYSKEDQRYSVVCNRKKIFICLLEF